MSDSSARHWFWSVVITFGVAWTFFPLYAIANYRPDVIEQFFVGREWVMASGKHPALTAWVLEGMACLLRNASFVPYLVSQLFVVATIWAIWRLGREYLSEKLAILAVFAMLNYWFFHFESTLYNNNITLDAVWALTVYFALMAFTRNRLFYWLMTGITIGVGLYFKYTLIILAFTLVGFLCGNRRGRRLWRNYGPWVTTGIALLIFLPYFLWLSKHDFITLQYAAGTVADGKYLKHIICPLHFVGTQIPYLIPIVIPLIPLCGWIGKWNRNRTDTYENIAVFSVPQVLSEKNNDQNDDNFTGVDKTSFPNDDSCQKMRFKERYLMTIVLAPFLFQLIFAGIRGYYLRGALGCQLWLFFTVFLLYFLQRDERPKQLRLSGKLSLGMAVLFLFLFSAGAKYSPYLTGKGDRYQFPGKKLAQSAEALWHSKYQKPLPWATGEWWLAGNVAVYGSDRARVHGRDGAKEFFNGGPLSTWSEDSDVRKDGGIVLWTIHDNNEAVPATLKEHFPATIVQEPFVLDWQTTAKIPPVVIGVAVVPPEQSR